MNKGLKERSGEIVSDDPLVAFVYLLLRDHLTAGDVEELMKACEEGDGFEFTNGFVAGHAIDVARRLQSK